jgi:DNA-directed RNA polymerase subunit M/transcription elongation factor TFIIS
MTNNNKIGCEKCGNTMTPHTKGKYIIYNCTKCNPNVDIETFVAEHYSEEE